MNRTNINDNLGLFYKINFISSIVIFSILLSFSIAYAANPVQGRNTKAAHSTWTGATYFSDALLPLIRANKGCTYPVDHGVDPGVAYVTGSWTPNPCNTGTGNSYFSNNGYYYNTPPPVNQILNTFSGTIEGAPNSDKAGGTILTSYFEDWWRNKLLKAMRAQTAQINANRIAQTKEIGMMFDGSNIQKGTYKEEKQELKAKKQNAPSEQICVAGSNATSIAKTSVVANALTKGFKADITKRSINAAGSSSSTGLAADQKVRWDHYCSIFHDPDNNNGVSSCPNPTTAGTVKNADINIEQFLLSDTIDMRNPDKVTASKEILQNLIEPTVKERIKDAAVKTVTGKEWLLKKQHIESVRNIATDVVASIISRRASVTGTSSGPLIKPIRINAGIEESRISDNPSYNEIMLALTKERFFDPNYFIKVQSSVSSMKQEETSIASYINIQLNDIYKLQEQINLLLAARAAMKFNATPKSQQLQAAPMSQ